MAKGFQNIMKITSVNNDLVKETAKLLKSKHRDETGLFLIEGEKGVKEAFNAGLKFERIFIQEGYNKDFPEKITIEATEAVLSKISEAKSAPKVVAVVHKPQYSIKEFKNYKKIILLEGIKDAGNLGTILRTASAFNIDGIILYGNTVDLYNPKCVRSTVGCLWKVPVIHIKDFNTLKKFFASFEKIATLPKGKNVTSLNNYIPNEKELVMFGSEADGLSEELKNFATQNLTIEMSDNVESLNLSISVAIIMYKITR